MTNEKGNGNDENDDGSSSGGGGANTIRPIDRRPIASATTSAHEMQQHPNGSIGGGYSDENNSLAECSASDDCGDKMAKESDPLQPKMVKSRSLNKVKVAAKEVNFNRKQNKFVAGHKAHSAFLFLFVLNTKKYSESPSYL